VSFNDTSEETSWTEAGARKKQTVKKKDSDVDVVTEPCGEK